MANWEGFLVCLLCQNTKILSLQKELQLIKKQAVFCGTYTCSSIVSSNKQNALAFEAGTHSSVFSLVSKKKQTSTVNLVSNNPEITDSIPNRNVEGFFESILESKKTDNILLCTSGCIIRNFILTIRTVQHQWYKGYVTRNFVKNIDCQDSAASIVQAAASTDQQFHMPLFQIAGIGVTWSKRHMLHKKLWLLQKKHLNSMSSIQTKNVLTLVNRCCI